MDRGTITRHHVNLLERVLLDGNAEPTYVPLSLLEDITNSFSDDQEIGRGGFAVVYKGILGKGMVAVKKLSRTYDLPESKFHKEVECLMKAKHKNIVRFLGYCSETHGRIADNDGQFVMADLRNWLLCFEYVPNGSLGDHITDASSGLEWRVRFEIIRGICEGLLHLHGKRILHLDLKPGNILVDYHMVPKIADFGLSRFLDKEQTRDITLNLCGTLGYLAPEFLRRGQVAFASDIYSLGVIIMEILTGEKEHPKYDNVVETWMNRLEGSDQWETQLEQVRVCTKIGIECMESNPKKRPVILAINSRLIMASTVKTGISIQSGANISSSNSGMLCKLIKLDSFGRKALRMFHKMNGGATLDRPKSTFTLFKKDELQPFLIDTNFIRKDGFGEVYKGLVDNVPVTVRKSISSIPVKLFALELGIQSQAIHKNIIRFIGCCLEVDTPVLVFEFHSTVSLHDILHINIEVPLNLETRLSIATTSAGALAYVHSAHGPKILHGDVRPANILLDDHFVVKISNFGLSRLIIKTGTIIDDLAYTDPVYLQTGLVTEKSDVYSFGLVILELLTRKKASCSDNNSLVRNFLENHNQGRKATEFFDKEIAVAGDLALLDNLANIVTECLSRDVDLRPGMKEVEQRINVLLQSLKL